MSWKPVYNATFTKPVVRQLAALIQRDIRAALDFVAGPDVLDEFIIYQFARYATLQFPSMSIIPGHAIFDQEAVGSSHSVSHFVVGVFVANHDPNTLAELTQDYLKATDLVLTALCLQLSDFYESWPLTISEKTPTINTEPLVSGSLKEMFVLGHDYTELGRQQNKYMMVATLDLLVEREES